MTKEEQRIAIALATGWKSVGSDSTTEWWVPPTIAPAVPHLSIREIQTHKRQLPDFCTDLNAMHEAEEFALHHLDLGFGWRAKYAHLLQDTYGTLGCVFTTAPQRAEIFVISIGKWKGKDPTRD